MSSEPTRIDLSRHLWTFEIPKDAEMCIINVYALLSKSGRWGDPVATGCHGDSRGSRWVLHVTAFCVIRVH